MKFFFDLSALLALSLGVPALADDCLLPEAQPGQICEGGSVFAGKIEDRAYMTTPTNGPIGKWGSFETHTGVTDPFNGAENTERLKNISPAASYCASLEFAGYSDWFLPSEMELSMLLSHARQIGSFTDDWYWSSTAPPLHPNLRPVIVRGTSVSLGRMTNLAKDWDCATRCVRIIAAEGI